VIRLLVAITIVKLALAGLPGGTADISQQRQQAERFLAGHDTLDPTVSNASAFLTGHNVLTAGALTAARVSGLPFRFWMRVPAIAADLGLGVVLLSMPGAGPAAALVYMLSPVSLLLAVYHGQVHTVAAVLAFVAIWLACRQSLLAAGVVLGLAVSVRQHFLVLAAPLARTLGARAIPAALAMAAVVVVVNLPLLTSAHAGRTLTPPAGYGTWGYTIPLVNGPRVLSVLGFPHVSTPALILVAALPALASVAHFAWAAAFAARVWWGRPLDAWRAALLFLVGFYAVTPSWGIQWLIWALPFWVVADRRGAVVYSAIAGAFLAVSYWVWTFNAKYGLESVTANLGALSGVDLALYVLAGALGIVTWAYCVLSAWRLWRA
jgi:hypothetical protein